MSEFDDILEYADRPDAVYIGAKTPGPYITTASIITTTEALAHASRLWGESFGLEQGVEGGKRLQGIEAYNAECERLEAREFLLIEKVPPLLEGGKVYRIEELSVTELAQVLTVVRKRPKWLMLPQAWEELLENEVRRMVYETTRAGAMQRLFDTHGA